MESKKKFIYRRRFIHYKMNNTTGNTSIYIIILLLFLSIIVISTGEYLLSFSKLERRLLARETLTQELESIGYLIIDEMKQDPVPSIDSTNDEVYYYIRSLEIDGYTIKLKDISSRINLNAIDFKIFSETESQLDLGLLSNSKSLTNRRNSIGLSMDFESDYADLFDKDCLNSFFSPYTWFNADLSDDNLIQNLLEQRSKTNDEDYFEKDSFIIDEEIKDPTAIDDGFLFPIVNSKRLMNLFFTPRPITEALVRHYLKGDSKKSITNKIDKLYSERESGDLTEKRIEEILDPQTLNEKKILNYLGTVTWFWECIITKEGISHTLRFVRLPTENKDNEEINYRIVESFSNKT